ncbi:MAG: BCAM0308 family protein [Nitrospirota bacterium]
MTMKRAKHGAGRKQPRLPSSPRRINPRQADPYTVRSPKTGFTACQGCHAIFEKKRWHFDEARFAELSRRKEVKLTTCPACQKIRDRYPEGILTLRWAGLAAHRDDVIGLLRKEETRAKGVNPLERIMGIEQDRGEWQVTTTNVKLAQRLGRELERAYRGKARYHWAHGDKLVRVVWERGE